MTLDQACGQLLARLIELERDQDYWIAVHALANNFYRIPPERRAEFDPLGMMTRSEELARHLTDRELEEAALAGYDDYWEYASRESHESYDVTSGQIDELCRTLGVLLQVDDGTMLDRINRWLSDPEWGVGMLEDICEAVRASGRDELDDGYWERH